MKTTRYILLPITLIALINVSIDAMKRQRDTGMIQLQCSHLTESIEVPETVMKHSVLLCDLFVESPFISTYVVDVADQETLSAIVDCLKIIDAGQEVENKLLDYLCDFVEKHTEELEKNNFIDAMKKFRIQQLSECFDCFQVYYERKKTNEMIHERLGNVIQEAKDVFLAIEDKRNSAIIIDVDNTALSCVVPFGTIVVNGFETPFPYFQALCPVRDLYKQMADLDFKIFFLTARIKKSSVNAPFSDGYAATLQNLKAEGYDVFEEIICVPYALRQQIWQESNDDNDLFVKLLAQWKEGERNKIAEKFTIVGTLDDGEENLQGSNVGHAVLIPRFS